MGEVFGAGSGNRTRALSLEGSYDTISPYPRRTREVCQPKLDVKARSAEYLSVWPSTTQPVIKPKSAQISGPHHASHQ